jgi:hypothetical protein
VSERAGTNALSVARVLALFVATLVIASCTGDGSTGRPTTTPTRSPVTIGSPTATIPSATRTPIRPDTPTETTEPSEPTDTTDASETTEATETTDETEPTEAAEPTETSPTRTPLRPETPIAAVTTTEPEPNTATTQPDSPAAATTTEAEPTQTSERPQTSAAQTPASLPTSSTGTEPTSAETTGPPSWVWWLLAAVALAAIVAVALIVRSRRRRSWQADFTAAADEVAWFSRVLLPALGQAASPDGVRSGWNVGAARVIALEDGLTGLEDSAPYDDARTRTRTLRDAVRTARTRLQVLLESGTPTPQDLNAIAAELETALASAGPLQSPQPPGDSPL